MADSKLALPRRYLIATMLPSGAAVVAFLLAFRLLTGLVYSYLEGILIALALSGQVLILRRNAKARRLRHG
jgi:hypothetical protein